MLCECSWLLGAPAIASLVPARTLARLPGSQSSWKGLPNLQRRAGQQRAAPGPRNVAEPQLQEGSPMENGWMLGLKQVPACLAVPSALAAVPSGEAPRQRGRTGGGGRLHAHSA